MKKKGLLVIVGVLVIVSLVLSGCATPAPEEEVTPAPEATELPVLKVGLPLPLTGFVADSAEEMADSFRMYLDGTDWTLGGLPVELFIEDTETLGEMVVTKAEKLINLDKVHFMCGPMLVLEAAAMRDPVVTNDIAWVSTCGSMAADIRDEVLYPNICRTAYGSYSQGPHCLGTYAYEELGYRKMAMLGQDYGWGWETTAGAQFAFEEAGGKVIQKLWAPIGTVDYGPFVTEVSKDADVLWVTLVGADVPKFVSAWNEYGMKDLIPVIGSEDLAGEDAKWYYDTEEAEGMIACTYVPVDIGTPEMNAWVAEATARWGREPTFWADSTYRAAIWIDEALWYLRDVKGVSPYELPDFVRDNPVDFIEAIKATPIQAPSGPAHLDEYNSAVLNVYIVELVWDEATERLRSEVLKTYPETSQFYHWTAEEFWERPDYSRYWPSVQ